MKRLICLFVLFTTVAISGCSKTDYHDLMESNKFDAKGNHIERTETRWVREKITREPVEREKVTVTREPK